MREKRKIVCPNDAIHKGVHVPDTCARCGALQSHRYSDCSAKHGSSECLQRLHKCFDHDTIVLVYEENEAQAPTRFWVHCGDRKCNRWLQVDFNARGGPSAMVMPKGCHLELSKTPILAGEHS